MYKRPKTMKLEHEAVRPPLFVEHNTRLLNEPPVSMINGMFYLNNSQYKSPPILPPYGSLKIWLERKVLLENTMKEALFRVQYTLIYLLAEPEDFKKCNFAILCEKYSIILKINTFFA